MRTTSTCSSLTLIHLPLSIYHSESLPSLWDGVHIDTPQYERPLAFYLFAKSHNLIVSHLTYHYLNWRRSWFEFDRSASEARGCHIDGAGNCTIFAGKKSRWSEVCEGTDIMVCGDPRAKRRLIPRTSVWLVMEEKVFSFVLRKLGCDHGTGWARRDGLAFVLFERSAHLRDQTYPRGDVFGQPKPCLRIVQYVPNVILLPAVTNVTPVEDLAKNNGAANRLSTSAQVRLANFQHIPTASPPISPFPSPPCVSPAPPPAPSARPCPPSYPWR